MTLVKKPEMPRVAVVDDNESFRSAVCRILENNGFAAEAHESVADFIREGGLVRAECLVLDVVMPEIDGLSLQSCLRGTNYNVPIIFCSGVSDHKAQQTALANGAVSFLAKPFEPKRLVEAVRSALTQRVQVRE